ncbi:MAG: trans-sialidase, partial [Candidatus Nitrosotenuis sp.]
MSSAKSTKKDLETKIAELEEKLTKLASQLEAKPTTQ